MLALSNFKSSWGQDVSWGPLVDPGSLVENHYPKQLFATLKQTD